MANSNKIPKRIRTEIKEVSTSKSEKVIQFFTFLFPGIHPLRRMLIPWGNLPDDLPKLQIAVVSYEFNGSVYSLNVDSYNELLLKDAQKEEMRIEKAFDRDYNSSFLSIGPSNKILINKLKRIGFKLSGKHLFNVIISYPSLEFGEFMFYKKRFILDQFDFGKSKLNASNKKKLNILIEYIDLTYNRGNDVKSYSPIQSLLVIGHTDAVGSEKSNEKLGLARAKVVGNIIKKNSSHIKLLPEFSYGEERLRVKTEEAEGKNRGVSIELYYPEKASLSLKIIKNDLLKTLKEKKAKTNQKIYKEVLCIAQKLDDLSVDDKYIPLSLARSKTSSTVVSLFPHLRIKLLQLKYKGNNDRYLSELFKIHEDIIKGIFELNKALKTIPNQLGGSNTFESRAQKQMKIFINERRKQEYDLPSIYECF